jgi:uncharacterized membrane protein
MQRVFAFIKTTAIGGLLVIVPVAIVLFVLAQLFLGLYGAAEAVAAFPPVAGLGLDLSDAVFLTIIALAALVGLCFATGLVFSTRAGEALKRWLSQNVARRIPMYRALSNLTRRVVGIDGAQFSPVEIDLYGSPARALGFLVEELSDGRCVVFVPTAPVATIGNVHIVPRTSMTPLAASVTDTASVITQWGVDAHELYRAPEAASDSGP